jgi:signal transduction histidine kinase
MLPSLPDPQALGQLLVMQSCIPLMDSDEKLFALVNRGLAQVPGIAGSAVRLSASPAVAAPGVEGHLALPIETLQERFGSLEVLVREVDQFVIYEPFLRNLAGIIALWLDNRARRRRLEEALQKIECALHEREAFLAVASHDLGSPLAAIITSAEALRESPESERVVAAAGLIERSARRMARLIRDLLDLASIDAGHFSMVSMPQDLGRLIEEAAEEARASAHGKAVALEVHLDGSEARVHCDGQRLAQVLSNLIGNAIKFTPPGGRVVVTNACLTGEVEVSVSDTGPGITGDDLPHVFDRFYRGPNTKQLGTGLGLAIAKAIVERHGGRIAVESHAGEGARFFFVLPLLAPSR